MNLFYYQLSEEKVQTETLASSQRRISLDFVGEKDVLQSKLINAETKLLNLETDLKEMKADYDDKITHLESDLAAKCTHIKQLVLVDTFEVERAPYPLHDTHPILAVEFKNSTVRDIMNLQSTRALTRTLLNKH